MSTLAWRSEPNGPGEWWVEPDFDWMRFAAVVDDRADLSHTERGLCKAACALAIGPGEVDFQALHAAGYLDEVLAIIGRCTAQLSAHSSSE